MKIDNLVELLRVRAEGHWGDLLFTFLGDGDGETDHLTFEQLDTQARALGAYLQTLGLVGERVLLVYPAGLQFISAFFGCLFAGVVAVPIPLIGQRRSMTRLQTILRDSGAKAILSTEQICAKWGGRKPEGFNLSSLKWLATDTLSSDGCAQWAAPTITADSLAYLQYTSGSTADPKGVMVTHGNVIHNLAYIEHGCEYTADSRLVSWLPHFHDMGLVNGILQPLFQGCRGILMPPQSFVQRPSRWLRAISHYRATHSGGPNFAYELCANRILPEERETLDLRSWILAYCGAEPVRHATLVHFHETFQTQGFSWSAFCPAYGLAETTLKVSAKNRKDTPALTTIQIPALEKNQVVEVDAHDPLGKTLVGNGQVGFGMKAMIVDPETFQGCGSHEIGEIWVAGPSVAKGYWNREAQTQATFRASVTNGEPGFFLRTGDLGFLREDQLFVTGRLKDLIIIRGHNYYPQDIEGTVERSHVSLRGGVGVAFSVEHDGDEKLVLVQECRRAGSEKDIHTIIETIRRAVAEEHHLSTFAVVLVRVGTIPKTSSGKVQRQACRRLYLAGTLNILAEDKLTGAISLNDALDGPTMELLSLKLDDQMTIIQGYLQERLTRILRRPSSRISAHDSLAAFGLDSLMIFELRQEVESRFGVVLPFSILMDGPTLVELSRNIADGIQKGSLQERVQRDSNQLETLRSSASKDDGGHQLNSFSLETEDSLSSGQQGLWMLQQEEPESDAYHIRFAARMCGDLDIQAFQKAFNLVMDRHSVLRTTFYERDGRVRQIPGPISNKYFTVIDAANYSPEAFNAMLEQEAYRPFNLETGPLIKVSIFVRGPQESVLLVVVNHMIMDLWSMTILLDDWRRLYVAEVKAHPETLAQLPATYATFVRRQEDQLASVDGKRLWKYWAKYLQGDLPVLRLPTDRPRLLGQDRLGAACSFLIPSPLTQQLKALAHARGTTLYVVLLSAFQVLLSRLAGQTEFVIGSPVAGRTTSDFEQVVGYFVNVLPLKVDLSDHPSFTALLSRNHRTVSQGLDHQDFPFPLIVDRLGLQREAGIPPLCQVMFAFERPYRLEEEGLSGFILGDANTHFDFGGLDLTPLPFSRRSSEMDLTLFLTEVSDSLHASFQYRTALFDGARIERMSGHFVKLLEEVVASPTCRVSEVSLLSHRERDQILSGWNHTVTDYPRRSTIQEIFEAQADQTPERIALVFEKTKLSYRELNTRANQVAHHLRKQGVETGQLVGVGMNRSCEMVIALLGILKAGCAYVPLDPSYPDERLHLMVEDTHLTCLLTQESLLTKFSQNGVKIVCLDSDWKTIKDQSTASLPCSITADALAYVIYTSGSTGRPKGVCIPHRGVVSLVKGTDYVDFNANHVFLQLAPLAVDPSTFEIWGALLNGARLVLCPQLQPTFDDLGRTIQDYAVTTMRLAADMFHRLVETDVKILSPLRQLIVGGNVLSASHANRMMKAIPNCRLINGYGPSENTTYSCCHVITESLDVEHAVPIGRPIANSQAYILTSNLQPVPVGVVGELYVGGDGLAQGYLNRPDLTRRKFIPHPFVNSMDFPQGGTELRIYNTGDLACFRKDGTIEFHGRVDHQVKVRGFRVELEEIEFVIRQHPGIQDAVVILRDIPRKYDGGRESNGAIKEQGLVAYIVRNGESAASESSVRSFLESKLPTHMIPALTVFLEALPRLPNGKVNRHSLPVPALAGIESSRAPLDHTEEVLVDIWREVLGIEDVGVEDNFFHLGGHSLLIIQVLSRVKRLLHVELSVRELFECPTIEKFAKRVAQVRLDTPSIAEKDITPHSREGGPVLSFSQERMWFLSQLEQGGTAYSMPLAIRLSGSLQIEALEACINEIRRRHEVLRTTFQTKNGWPVPVIHPFQAQPLPLVTLEEIPEAEKEGEFQRRAIQDIQQPFDLVSGPVFRVTLFRLHEMQHVLLVTMHHIITDTWSLSVFFQELESLYSAFSQGNPSSLSPLAIQYSDFASWQKQWLAGQERDRQLSYWTRHLSNASTVLNLPTDHPRPVRQTYQGARETQALSPWLMDRLQTVCRQEGVTLFMVMLSAFNVMLSKFTRQTDVLVGTPVANRRWVDTEKLLGAFVNTLVLRSDLSGEPTFRQLLAQIKETTLGAYANQDLPFEDLLGALNLQRDLSRTPLFQVMFSMPNVPMPQLRWPKLDVEVMPLDRGGAQFDLTLFVLDIPGKGPVVMLEYNTQLFEASTITRWLSHYQHLLHSIVNNLDQPIATLSLMADSERQTLLETWNDTELKYAKTQCLHHLVEAQVTKTPHAIAVVCENEGLTYQELNQRANQVAHYLQKLGIGPESLVGILLDRSVDMLVALLGVLKAGGAYVPMDPSYPKDRLGFMVEDSHISVLITHSHLLEHLSQVSKANGSPELHSGPQVILMSAELWAQESMDNPCVPVESTNLAYLIYTSGSTGKPKGVMISHRAVVNFMEAMQREPGLTPQDRLLAVTSLSFDIAVLELFLPLVVGAQVVLANREIVSDGGKLSRLIHVSKATVMQGTPATWWLLVKAGWQAPSGFRCFSGGEALSRRLANSLLAQGVDLWNLYGPTETTIWSAVHRVVSGEEVIPLGHPIANTQLYVLDPSRQLVPLGVPGELCIGGEGLARGYMNHPEMTDQQFIPNPFRADPLSKLYKTGDLVKYRSDGTLEFLGRLDHQIKLRGFRIELGEIEAVLSRHTLVQHCVVMVRDPERTGLKEENPNSGFEEKQLVVFIVPTDITLADSPNENSIKELDAQDSCASELRIFAGKYLPQYMVPSKVLFLKTIPLTPNGKIDRQLLSTLHRKTRLPSNPQAERTPLEHQLAQIWSKVLGRQHVEVKDDFFELGGHSLLANYLLSLVHSELGVEIALPTFFEQPTIEHVAKHVEMVRWLSTSKPVESCTLAADREDQLL
jgi:amino acid adenylation domain-containing protein